MSEPITRLREIMHTLRSPGGCPWDQEQTHESLIPNLIEEAYETAAAIRSRDDAHLEEELGDLLLQVVFHAELGSETGAFNFDSICTAIADKLVRRHPHVYGESKVSTTEGVLQQWEEIKDREKSGQTGAAAPGYLAKVGTGFPALLKAQELQKKAARTGFDWPDSGGAWEKVEEELAEVAAARSTGDRQDLGEELGDLLFSLVNVIRKEGLNAECLLDAANEKFTTRFHAIEQALLARRQRLGEVSLAELDALWESSKTPRH